MLPPLASSRPLAPQKIGLVLTLAVLLAYLSRRSLSIRWLARRTTSSQRLSPMRITDQSLRRLSQCRNHLLQTAAITTLAALATILATLGSVSQALAHGGSHSGGNNSAFDSSSDSSSDDGSGGWSFPSFFSGPSSVGTPEWWKKNKRKRKFVVSKGYTVEGVEGYFDQNGRPLDRPVERTALNPKPQGLIPGVDPKVAYGRVKSAVGKGANQTTAKQLFEEAENLFGQGQYFKAAWHYRDAAGRWPGSQLEEDSLFMIGECHFFEDRYLKSRDAFNALVEKHPNSRHMNALVERQWEIAQYWEREYFASSQLPLSPNMIDKTRPSFDTIGHALKTYENIRLNDPTGPRADDAVLATASIQFRRKRFDDADYNYTLLRQEYPRSEFQFEAHLLGLQSKLHKYQGPDYDGKALEEAKRLATRLRRQFGGRLAAEEKERLQLVQAELNLQIAQRDLKLAEYYEGKKHYLAARTHYIEVIEKHADTGLAKEARKRLAAISDRLDVPPERMAWFTGLFPESRELKRVARIPELKDGKTLIAVAPEETGPAVTPASATSTR